MPPKKGKKKAYEMAPEMPAREVIVDQRKRRWKLGKAFASGGFGRIYTATSVDGVGEMVVVKMEPAENGPLFQEMHVYQRILKPEAIADWKQKQKLKYLGLPPFLGCGKHEKNGLTHRFLIMPSYGKDLESFRLKTPSMDPQIVFPLAENILNALQYLHNARYVHADVKADNLLLEHPKSKDLSRLVLVDFGLAKKVADKPTYREDPKKAHDGTLIFTSLDAHRGCAPSFRGDIEILAYNLIYWLTGSLPWVKETDPGKVFNKKQDFSKQFSKELKTLFPNSTAESSTLTKIFEHVFGLEYTEQPNYDVLRKLLETAAKSTTKKAQPKTSKRRSAANGANSSTRNVEDDQDDEDVPTTSRGRPRKTAKRESNTSAEVSSSLSTSTSLSSVEKGPATKKVLAKSPSPTKLKEARKVVAAGRVVKKKSPIVPTKKAAKTTTEGKAARTTTTEEKDEDEDMIAGTPSPVGKVKRMHRVDPISTAVRKAMAKTSPNNIIPGLANMRQTRASPNGAAGTSPGTSGAKIIPGLANMKRHRRSMEATIVKKYLHASGSASRNTGKTTAKAGNTPANKTTEGAKMADAHSQTSPYLWYPKRNGVTKK